MGTSSRSPPVISGGGKSRKLEKLQEFVRSKKGQKTARFCLKASLNCFPSGQSIIPLYYALIYGCKILKYSKEGITTGVVEDIFLKELERKAAKDFSELAWDFIGDHLVEENVDRSLVKFSETAFTQVMAEVMIEGADAI